jgi:hypothetical protein
MRVAKRIVASGVVAALAVAQLAGCVDVVEVQHARPAWPAPMPVATGACPRLAGRYLNQGEAAPAQARGWGGDATLIANVYPAAPGLARLERVRTVRLEQPGPDALRVVSEGDPAFGARTFLSSRGEFSCDGSGLIFSTPRAARWTRRSFRMLADGSVEMHYWIYDEPWATAVGSAGVEDGYLRWRPDAGERP